MENKGALPCGAAPGWPSLLLIHSVMQGFCRPARTVFSTADRDSLHPQGVSMVSKPNAGCRALQYNPRSLISNTKVRPREFKDPSIWGYITYVARLDGLTFCAISLQGAQMLLRGSLQM